MMPRVIYWIERIRHWWIPLLFVHVHFRSRAMNDECSKCGVMICPEFDPLHFHHDGCPSCDLTVFDALEKELKEEK